MVDVTLTQKQMIWGAILRLVRSAVAFGLPYLLTVIANNPDVRIVALGPVIMAIGKYLRDAYKLEWLPV